MCIKNKIRILDFQEVAKGIKLCLDNAKSLLEEAKILNNNKKYRGCVVLSLFASEELAKIEQIFNLLEPVNSKDVKKKWNDFYWKKFRSHDKKIISSFTHKIIADIEQTGGKEIERYLSNSKPKNMPNLVTLKEACLYVDCDLSKKEFIAPYKISEDMTAGLIENVEEHLKGYEEHFDKHTIEEIEKGLSEYAGDKYWEERPFEPDSKRIKDKLKEIESRVKQKKK